MKRKQVIPNPLSNVIYDELTPIMEAIYIATDGMIELEGCRSGGIQAVDLGTQEFRTSTDAECCEVRFELLTKEFTLDARKPMFRQLAAWLKKLADNIDEARASLERIEGVRDVVVIPRKKAGAA